MKPVALLDTLLRRIGQITEAVFRPIDFASVMQPRAGKSQVSDSGKGQFRTLGHSYGLSK